MNNMKTNYKNYNETEIREFISKSMDKWLFDRDSHIEQRHMNATEEELISRIGKYSDNGKLLFRASTFVDDGSGDAIVSGLIGDLSSYAPKIVAWLKSGDRDDLNIIISEMPLGVTGLMASYDGNWMPRAGISDHIHTYPVSSYKIVLCRDAFHPFYLLNAYPIA